MGGDLTSGSGWRFVWASVKGTGHVTAGLPCQDASDVQLHLTSDDEPLLLLVTSDGAGSAAHSEVGAQLACEQTMRWMANRLSQAGEHLSELDGQKLVHDLRTMLTNCAEELQHDLRDLACTLNVAAILPGYQWYLQVGDGATVVQAGDEPLRVVFWPDNGEYANQTYFLTDVPDDHIHVRSGNEDVTRVALMTDGLQSLALSLQQRAAHAPFFSPMFGTVETLVPGDDAGRTMMKASLRTYLDSPAVNARTSDDKTLVLASCRAVMVATVEVTS